MFIGFVWQLSFGEPMLMLPLMATMTQSSSWATAGSIFRRFPVVCSSSEYCKLLHWTAAHLLIFLVLNPPTPAASRGSASEEALLATRGAKRKSADPCRQQGERIREEITSNKCCAVQVRGKSGGGQKGKQGAVQEARKRKRERRGSPSDRSKRKKHETRS